MADDLSFTISAQDQASKAVETIQKKIQDFGKDVAKSALAIVGPMALLQAGIGYVTQKWQEYQQAKQEAFDKGASGTYEEVKAQEALGEQLDRNLSALLAMAKVQQENAKNAEDIRTQENMAIEEFKKSQAGQKFIEKNIDIMGGYRATRDEELQAAKAEGAKIQLEINRKKAEELAKLQGPQITDEQRKALEEIAKINDELAKRGGKSLFNINALDIFTKNFKEDMALPKQKTKEETKDQIKLTVSSLREIGGSFGGGDVATGLERQISIAEKQLDTLNEIKDALNRGSQESQVFPESLRTAMETTA